MILEYQKDARYGDLKSPRANRFIAHCDGTNARMKPMPEFHAALNEFKPEMVVMAGLHLLEREPVDFQDQVPTALSAAPLGPSRVPLRLKLEMFFHFRL